VLFWQKYCERKNSPREGWQSKTDGVFPHSKIQVSLFFVSLLFIFIVNLSMKNRFQTGTKSYNSEETIYFSKSSFLATDFSKPTNLNQFSVEVSRSKEAVIKLIS
jgi:hypothetical protein